VPDIAFAFWRANLLLSADELGISERMFYRWKCKVAGIGVAELRRLQHVEDENRRLKQLVAHLILDRQMRQEALRKGVSERQARVAVRESRRWRAHIWD
jgi:putative transposase